MYNAITVHRAQSATTSNGRKVTCWPYYEIVKVSWYEGCRPNSYKLNGYWRSPKLAMTLAQEIGNQQKLPVLEMNSRPWLSQRWGKLNGMNEVEKA